MLRWGPVLLQSHGLFFSANQKSFLWNFFSTQAAFPPFSLVFWTFYQTVFHVLPFQRRYLEMTDVLNYSSFGGSFWPET